MVLNSGDLIDMGSIPRSGRFPGGHGNPLQYSCLKNPRDRGAWWAMVHRFEKSWTPLKQLSMRNPSSPWVLDKSPVHCVCPEDPRQLLPALPTFASPLLYLWSWRNFLAHKFQEIYYFLRHPSLENVAFQYRLRTRLRSQLSSGSRISLERRWEGHQPSVTP